jgi:hypothetical protein
MRSPIFAIAASLTLLGWFVSGPAQAGLITIVTGAANSTARTATAMLQYDAPNGSTFMSINRAKGIGTLEAGMGGGKVFFTARGTPVAMNLNSGAGYITSGTLPLGLNGPSVLSWNVSDLATDFPVAKGTIDTNAVLLDIYYVASEQNPGRQLKIELFNSNGNMLATEMAPLPDGGWWVLGLDPQEKLKPGGPDPTPAPGGTGDPDPTTSPTPTVPGVPEPGTITLGLTGISLALLRALRRRRIK